MHFLNETTCTCMLHWPHRLHIMLFLLKSVLFAPLGMKLLNIVSLTLSAKLNLIKMSSVDRLCQLSKPQEDDWHLYFDHLASQSMAKPRECYYAHRV